MKLLEGIVNTLYSSKWVHSTFAGRYITDALPSSNPDMLSAILNSWANLLKRRPALTEWVMQSLTQWTPVKLEGLPASSIRSIEKSVRILLTHISRSVVFHVRSIARDSSSAEPPKVNPSSRPSKPLLRIKLPGWNRRWQQRRLARPKQQRPTGNVRRQQLLSSTLQMQNGSSSSRMSLLLPPRASTSAPSPQLWLRT